MDHLLFIVHYSLVLFYFLLEMDIFRKLTEALQSNNYDYIKNLVKEYPDFIHLRNKYQETPLIVASIYKNYRVCKLLLENGSDINAQDEEGNTPLIHACSIHFEHPLQNLKVVKLLLESGSDPNLSAFDGHSPLYQAIIFRYYEIVKILVSYGADVNQPDVEENSPLFIAILENDTKMCNLLLTLGANITPELIKNIPNAPEYKNITNWIKDVYSVQRFTYMMHKTNRDIGLVRWYQTYL
jgi:ankyrin repeat protein